MNTDTELINDIYNKLLELLNLWIQGANLDLSSQSNKMSEILMYGGIASAIASIILVAVTAWYAVLTRRIVASNESLVQQNIMPFLYIWPPSQGSSNLDTVYFDIKVSNIGRGPALYIELAELPEGIEAYSEISNMLEVESFMKIGFKTTSEEMNKTLRPVFGKYNDLYNEEIGSKYDFSKFYMILRYRDMSGTEYRVTWPQNELNLKVRQAEVNENSRGHIFRRNKKYM